MKKEKGFINTIVSTFFGLIMFFVLLWIISWMSDILGYESFISIASFFRERVAFLVSITIIMFIADLFYILILPLKFVSSGFRAIGSAMIVWFTVDLFLLLDEILLTNIYPSLNKFQILIAVVVFLIVFVFSALHIVYSFEGNKNEKEQDKKDKDKVDFQSLKEEMKKIPETVKKNITEAIGKKEEKEPEKKRIDKLKKKKNK